VSDRFFTSAPVIELFAICLPVMSADVVATAVPVSATKSASIAMTIAGDTRLRTFLTIGSPFVVGVSHPSVRRRTDGISEVGKARFGKMKT
jgi:hypothetical protein